MDDSDYNLSIEAIYAGILSPDGFNLGLELVRKAFGIELSCLLLWDRRSDLIRVIGSAGMRSEFQVDYESHYQFVDPVKQDFTRIPEADWWIDTHRLDPSRMRSSAFHHEFLRPYDMSSFMASPIFRSPDTEVSLTLVRSNSHGVFSQTDANTIRPIVLHLRRAVQLRERIEELTVAASLTQALLERLAFGVAIIDSKLKVLSSNTRGLQQLAQLGPPSKWRQRLPDSSCTLEQMIQEACKPDEPAPVQAATFRSRGQPPCKLLVLPLAATHRFSLGWQQPAALTIFHEPRPSTRLLTHILKELYGLNPSEARLALRLADGTRLWTAADELRVTRETARSTLKFVFRKTNTSSQAQLVRLLSVLTAIDTPPTTR